MKIIKNIPNTITSLNLLCGVLGVIFVLEGKPETAFYLMLAAAACDFCDGLAARALGAYSDMGKELDSLADMVSFGVLPSLMLYKLMADHCAEGNILAYVPLMLALFSGLRLAKFNIDDRQQDNFIGLASPASAMICGSLTYYVHRDPESFLAGLTGGDVFIPVLTLVLSVLMVVEIPMFSMKFKKGQKRGTPLYRLRISMIAVFLISVLLVALMGLNWSMIILLTFTVYVLMNIFALFIK